MRFIALGACAMLMVASTVGCGGSGATDRAPTVGVRTKLVVVLFDRTASTKNDRPIYRRALEAVLGSLQPGDRLVVGVITGMSGADFADSLDVSIPERLPSAGWTDDPTQFQIQQEVRTKAIRQATQKIHDGVRQLLDSDSRAPQSAIFESLRMVAPFFESDRRHDHLLLVLSDMVEDSAIANFEHAVLSASLISEEIGRQQRNGSLPEFRGVNVYVIGALASPPERAVAVERFWTAYFKQAGATLEKGHYARVLTSFP